MKHLDVGFIAAIETQFCIYSFFTFYGKLLSGLDIPSCSPSTIQWSKRTSRATNHAILVRNDGAPFEIIISK